MADREEEFLVFVSVHGPSLRGQALLLTVDQHEAADLYQETLAKLFAAWPRIRKSGATLGYARTTMTRQLISWRRRGWDRREHSVEAIPDTATAKAPANVEETSVLFDALRKLSRQQRAVVVLRYYCDWSEARTAEAIGCSIGTVKTQASRGLSRLRKDPNLTVQGRAHE